MLFGSHPCQSSVTVVKSGRELTVVLEVWFSRCCFGSSVSEYWLNSEETVQNIYKVLLMVHVGCYINIYVSLGIV